MQHVISRENFQFNHGLHTTRPLAANLVNRFFTWCGSQENSRFTWLALALVAGIATILPLTLFAIVQFAGNSFNLWATACVINVPVLVVSLATQQMKFTLPVIFFAWLVDAIIVVYCIASFLAV